MITRFIWCLLCQTEPADDVLERPAGEVTEEGEHGNHNCKKDDRPQCCSKAAHAAASAIQVDSLEGLDVRAAGQLFRSGSDELAFATVRAVFHIVRNACSTLAPHNGLPFRFVSMFIMADACTTVKVLNGTVHRHLHAENALGIVELSG